MNDYTVRDRKNYGDTDVTKVAYPKFLEKLSRCKDLFHGYNYRDFNKGGDFEAFFFCVALLFFLAALMK